MFMHGPSTQCSWECVDIAFVYVRRISSPGVARITGGSSRPSNENAALPVWGSLIAFKETGERVSGGSDSRTGLETVIALAAASNDANKPTRRNARKLRPLYEIITLCWHALCHSEDPLGSAGNRYVSPNCCQRSDMQ